MKDKYKQDKPKRCPNGTRFNQKTGQCEDKKEAALKKFCLLATQLKKALHKKNNKN